MNNEQKLLLSLIRASIKNDKIKPIKNIDYTLLFKEARQQSVFLMVADEAFKQNLPIQKEVMVENKKIAFLKLTRNAEVENYQKNLCKLLKDNNFDYVIIKGTSSAAFYNKPQFRSLGDVDFLIDKKDKDNIEKLLLKEGFEKHLEGHNCHIVFKKNKAHLEMHFEVAGVPDGEKGEIIRDFLNKAVYNVDIKNIGSGEFNSPDLIRHGVIILLHIAHHLLNEGLGLRHLLDWGFYINSFASEDKIKELFNILNDFGLLEFAKVLTKTCNLYFGTKNLEITSDIENNICEELIEDILNSGNFGRKDKNYQKSGILVTDAKNGVTKGKAATIISVLKGTMYSKYPFLKKYKILYPIIFVWRFVRYFFLMLIGKRKNPINLMPIAEKRKALYKKLKIFE